MEPEQKRKQAEQSLERSTRVISKCLQRADAGDTYFQSRRATLESLRDQTDSERLATMGTKRLMSTNRLVAAELARLEREFIVDRQRQVDEKKQQAEEARMEVERERSWRTAIAQNRQAKRWRTGTTPSLSRKTSLGIRFDMRNE